MNAEETPQGPLTLPCLRRADLQKGIGFVCNHPPPCLTREELPDMTTAKNKLVIIPTGISGHGFVTGYEVLNEAEHRLAWFGVDEVHSPEREANTALALRQAEQFVGTHNNQAATDAPLLPTESPKPSSGLSA